jgi:predicted lactoylglutathione lyase
MARMIFVNYAVSDIAASEKFYTALGFTKNPQFSDDSTSALGLSDEIVFMIHTKEKLATFTKKEIIDPKDKVEALFALSADSREEVDTFVANGLANGGSPAGDVQDLGFMYGHSVQDPDGHVLEIAYMDMSQFPSE